jgi:hypothetical protein
MLISYEKGKYDEPKKYKSIFKQDPTSNVDYNQDMDLKTEGLDKDDADDLDGLKVLAFHGRMSQMIHVINHGDNAIVNVGKTSLCYEAPLMKNCGGFYCML